METKIDTDKILITRTFYGDSSNLGLGTPITNVVTKVYVDDELWYRDNINEQLYAKTPSKISDFLDWLFLTQPQNKEEKRINIDLKELLAPIVREIIDEKNKINGEQFYNNMIESITAQIVKAGGSKF